MVAGPSPTLRVPFFSGGNLRDDYITSLELESRIVSGKVKLTDYNFEMPSTNLTNTVSGQDSETQKYRLYDYPGGYMKMGEATRLTRLRVEEAESLTTVINGTTNYRGMNSGQKFSIEEHYRDDINTEYHILSATHTATQTGYRSRTGGQEFIFETTFEAIPA